MAADRVTDAMVLAACNAYADKLGELYGEGEAVSAPMRAALTAALRAEAGAVDHLRVPVGPRQPAPGGERVSITTEQAVIELKRVGLSRPAREVAKALGTDSRAVATALRGAVADGRVSINYKAKDGVARYRFVRLKPKDKA